MSVERPVYELSDSELIVEHDLIDFDPEDGSRSDCLYEEMIARGLVY